jgi:hypothetical protein
VIIEKVSQRLKGFSGGFDGAGKLLCKQRQLTFHAKLSTLQ